MAAIELHNVVYSVEGREILRDISFLVEEGQVFALVGPSGCGKTTTLRIISGLCRPDRGVSLVFDKEAAGYTGDNRCVATVWQSRALFPHLSVLANIEFGLKVRRIEHRERRRRVQAVVDQLHLTTLLKRDPTTLSGGEQQRVALARALVVRPRVLLLDEPFTGLDAVFKLQLQNDLRELLAAGGRTYVLVSHSLQDMLPLAHRMAVLEAGRIVQIDVPRRIRHFPETPFVAELFGVGNIVPGTVRNVQEGGEMVQVDTGCGSLWEGQDRQSAAEGDRVAYVISPQDLRLDGVGDCQTTASFHGVEWSGAQEFCCFRLRNDILVRVVSPLREDDLGNKFSPGEQVKLSWDPAKAFVLKR